jgi:c-di-GMP phosphodiesterase
MTHSLTLWLARLAVTKRGFWAITLLFSVCLALISLVASLPVISSINQKTLRTLDAQLLRRAELAIDYAFIALGELSEKGATTCEFSSLVEFRKTIYHYSVIKDIRVSDSSSNVSCSANPETLEFAGPASEGARPLPSRNRRVSLFRIEQNGGAALGVRWAFEDNNSLDAIVSTSSLLFDILPEDLRENGTSSLTLTDGRTVAEIDLKNELDPARQKRVTIVSDRYPIVASIGVDIDTMARSNRETRALIVLLFAAIGFAIGLLATTIAVQSAGPVAEIDAALSRKEFVPYVQPIFSLATQRIVGVEVLARWRRADGTLIPPDRFIKTAETSGRIVPVTWQLATSALAGLKHQLATDRQFKVAFNVAPSHLLSSGFVRDFRRIALESRVSPHQIVIEITERQEISDIHRAAQVLEQLRHRGFRIAFDDVGTGHNGLSYLQKLPADIIKIDKFLVDSIATSHSAKVLVGMLVNAARALKMTTVAEGIETAEQASVLLQYGVDQGQGYLKSRPLPIPAFLTLIQSEATADSSFAQDLTTAHVEALTA